MKKILPLLLLIMVAIAIVYHFTDQKTGVEKPRKVLSLLDKTCDPGQSICVAVDKDYQVSLHFPQQVHYLQPFRMQVKASGFEDEQIEAVYVDYTMVGMDMGLNRFSLLPITQANGQQFYQGDGILPVCVSGRVDWLANVNIVTAETVYEAIFKLEVTK